jgi:chemotaxis signal transduction protein
MDHAPRPSRNPPGPFPVAPHAAPSVSDAGGQPAPAPLAWCLFRAGSRPLAVPLECVAEIVEAAAVVPVPMVPPVIAGLHAWRREVVPVVELDALTAAGPRHPEGSGALLILRTGQGPWGLRIDRAGTSVVRDPRAAESLCGAVERSGVVYTILDPETVWQETRAAVRAWYEASCPEIDSARGEGERAVGPARGRHQPAETDTETHS